MTYTYLMIFHFTHDFPIKYRIYDSSLHEKYRKE